MEIHGVLRNGKGDAQRVFVFFSWKPCITVRVGAAMPAWEIAITVRGSSFFAYESNVKSTMVTLDCYCLHKFLTTSFSLILHFLFVVWFFFFTSWNQNSPVEASTMYGCTYDWIAWCGLRFVFLFTDCMPHYWLF